MLRISPINNTPNFKSNQRLVCNNKGQVVYQNTTVFFRDDIDWGMFVNMLKARFKNAEKVNVFSLACSDGSEPWTLAVLLKEILGDESDKFFPIYASDIDSEIIRRAKHEPCTVTPCDIRLLRRCTNDNFNKYFEYTEAKYKDFAFNEGAVRPTEYMNSLVNFKTSDITKEIKNIPPENSVVLCRNCWSYFPFHKRYEVAQTLKNQLEGNSIVVLGGLENAFNHDGILRDNGFRQTWLENVFEKDNYRY